MKKYEVFQSEGGYRVARQIVNGGPVMNQSPWYETKRAATCAANNFKKRNLRR